MNIFSSHLFSKSDDIAWSKFHGILLGASGVLTNVPSIISLAGHTNLLLEYVCKALSDDKPQIAESAVDLAGQLLSDSETLDNDTRLLLISNLVSVIKPENPRIDSRRMAVTVIKNAAKKNHAVSLIDFTK